MLNPSYSYSKDASALLTDHQRCTVSWHASCRGLSPASLGSAYTDWLVHLAISPGEPQELVAKAARRRPASSWARVPVVLTSRPDSAHSRIASCAIALLLIKHHFRELT
ncbi:hypothetical protein EUB48_06390 [Rhodoferax sediminis]|uniref:Poly-beta-hydroxybutyrate polymerase N-terminal domain-containing protein n=1 Tax=Rhodoferax sediminis TaxID=2509614 RepID=A0A515DH03_9BURK|nr:hypothetical protein EUB48_06390 [Rhodoferax sediminis]